MVAADIKRNASRSRSPAATTMNGQVSWKKDSPVQFFHAVDPTNLYGQYVTPSAMPGPGPRLLQSHGWFDGKLVEDFNPENFNPMKKDTWPNVQPRPHLRWTARDAAGKLAQVGMMRRAQMQHIRKPSQKQPLLSLVFVRWGGEDAVQGPSESEESNDGDWGQYGAPSTDDY